MILWFDIFEQKLYIVEIEMIQQRIPLFVI